LNSDVTPADVSLRANSNGDLILSINSTGDTLTVANFFSNPTYQIEQIQFADGTTWDVNEMYRQEL